MSCERMMHTLWFAAISWNTPNSLLVFSSLYVVAQGLGLKFVQMDVPGALHSGESTWLVCDYDLGEDELYSVKWYKNNLEFYRYIPSDIPAGQKYDLVGIYVDLRQSNATHVYMTRTDLNTEGNYGCEVSTEAPSFRTVKADKELRIYVIPTSGPSIEGIEAPYEIGDTVNITCVSGQSKPFSHMKWFINAVEVLPTTEFRYPSIRHSNGLQTTVIGIQFSIEYSHFWQGKIVIECTSSIPQVYSSASEELVIGDKGSSVNPYQVSHKAPEQKGPSIVGNLPWYDVGDLVNLNCSSARTPIRAHIRWFVNSMEPKKEYLIKYPTIRYSDNTEVSRLGLRMPVEPHHFRSDELRIKCTSTLYRMLTRKTQTALFSSAEKHTFLQYDPSIASTHRVSFGTVLLVLLIAINELVRTDMVLT